MTLSDREIDSIQIRLDAAVSPWPPTPAALRELVALAREDLRVVLEDLRRCRQAQTAYSEHDLEPIEEPAS